MRSRPRPRFLVALAVLLSGCGNGGEDAAFPERKVNEPDPAAGGELRGVVRFDGAPPHRRELDMGADAQCRHDGQGPVLEENVVVTDGRLRDVFVHVVSGLDGYVFGYEKTEAVMDQKGCVFAPHAVGVRRHQPVVFKNSDRAIHNVKGPDFNRTVNPGQSFTHQFTQDGTDIRVSCSIHPWMLGHLHVVDHPYFAVSAGDGAFALPRKLPAGTYDVEAVHPILGKQKQQVTIKEGETVEMEFVFRRR